MYVDFPPPDAAALKQSRRLVDLLCQEIEKSGGWLSFARYMERVLYAPGVGYYSGGAYKFGTEGDFITAPGLTPLFGQALAVQIEEIMALSVPEVMEVGAGTGQLAADMLLELESRGSLPRRYAILEVSAELRARQYETLKAQVPHLLGCVSWLDRLPETFSGVVVANEVLDAMPVHLLVVRAGHLFERGVAIDPSPCHEAMNSGLCWADVPPVGRVCEAAQALDLLLHSDDKHSEYVTELNLAARAWIATLAECLVQGALLLIDYGYPQREYYLPVRSAGTLMCYYRHRAHNNPFLWPGLNDVTASVDFTAIAEAAFDNGLEVLGYTSQAHFLLNCGILECLARRGGQTEQGYIRAVNAVQRLTGPHEMGELFKVLAVGRNIAPPLLGFTSGDRLHTL